MLYMRERLICLTSPDPPKSRHVQKRHVSADHRASPSGRTKKNEYEKKVKMKITGGKWAWHWRRIPRYIRKSTIFEAPQTGNRKDPNQIHGNKNTKIPQATLIPPRTGSHFSSPDTSRKEESKDITSMIRIQCGTPTIPSQSAQNFDPSIGAIRREVTMFATTCRPNI